MQFRLGSKLDTGKKRNIAEFYKDRHNVSTSQIPNLLRFQGCWVVRCLKTKAGVPAILSSYDVQRFREEMFAEARDGHRNLLVYGATPSLFAQLLCAGSFPNLPIFYSRFSTLFFINAIVDFRRIGRMRSE